MGLGFVALAELIPFALEQLDRLFDSNEITKEQYDSVKKGYQDARSARQDAVADFFTAIEE